MSDQDLELFTGRARHNELSVTIQRGGRFVVAQGIATLMGDPPMVELLFDRGKRQMAIRPAIPGSIYAYPLRRHQRPSTRLISGRKFMNHYGLSHHITRRYKATWDGERLLVDLTEEARSDVSEKPSVSSQEPVDAQHTRVG